MLSPTELWAKWKLEEQGRKRHLIFTRKRDLKRMPQLDQLDGAAKADRLWLEGLVCALKAWIPESGDKKPSVFRPKENLTGVWVDDPTDSAKLRWRPAKRDAKRGWIFLDGEKERTPATWPATTEHVQHDGESAQLDAELEAEIKPSTTRKAQLEATKGLALSTAGIVHLAFAVAAWCLSLPLRAAAWCLSLALRVGRRLVSAVNLSL
jgi:hypothetical protein